MAITKAEVLSAVLQRLRKYNVEITNIDEELRSILYDISTRDDFLKATGTITTVDGDYDYVASAVFAYLKSPLVLRQLTEDVLTPITFEEFQENLQDATTPTEGDPYEYAFWNETFYLWPVPDAAYTVNVYYSKYHANSVSAIEFGETFRECIYCGVLMKLWEGQLAYMQTIAQIEYPKQYQLYEKEIQKRQGNLFNDPAIVQFHDI